VDEGADEGTRGIGPPVEGNLGVGTDRGERPVGADLVCV
jgi:hypothetical protein